MIKTIGTRRKINYPTPTTLEDKQKISEMLEKAKKLKTSHENGDIEYLTNFLNESEKEEMSKVNQFHKNEMKDMLAMLEKDPKFSQVIKDLENQALNKINDDFTKNPILGFEKLKKQDELMAQDKDDLIKNTSPDLNFDDCYLFSEIPKDSPKITEENILNFFDTFNKFMFFLEEDSQKNKKSNDLNDISFLKKDSKPTEIKQVFQVKSSVETDAKEEALFKKIMEKASVTEISLPKNASVGEVTLPSNENPPLELSKKTNFMKRAFANLSSGQDCENNVREKKEAKDLFIKYRDTLLLEIINSNFNMLQLGKFFADYSANDPGALEIIINQIKKLNIAEERKKAAIDHLTYFRNNKLSNKEYSENEKLQAIYERKYNYLEQAERFLKEHQQAKVKQVMSEIIDVDKIPDMIPPVEIVEERISRADSSVYFNQGGFIKTG